MDAVRRTNHHFCDIPVTHQYSIHKYEETPGKKQIEVFIRALQKCKDYDESQEETEKPFHIKGD